MNTATSTATLTSSSRAAQLGRESRVDSDTYHPAWDGSPVSRLIKDAEGLTVLAASDVIDRGRPVGTHVELALEAFSELGLDVFSEDEVLQLTGSNEDMARVASLLSEAGAKLQSYLDSLTDAGLTGESDDAYTEAVVLHYVGRNPSGETITTLCGEAWKAEAADYSAAASGADEQTIICPICGDIYAGLPQTA